MFLVFFKLLRLLTVSLTWSALEHLNYIMGRLSHLWVAAFVGMLFAVAWQTVKADPFIPVGNDPGGTGDELTLLNVNSGLTWRTSSLMYVYISVPTPGAENNETLYKTMFFPPIDKFSKLTIPGTYEKFVVNTTSPEGLTMWVSAFGMNSTAVRYVQRTGGEYTVGSWTLVVTMQKGVANALTWIDGCSECACSSSSSNTANTGTSFTCPDSACITNNCGINRVDCTALAPDSCDMKIYLGWVGTDAHNRPCTSSGSLPYNFLQFGLSPAYRAAAGVEKQWLFNLKFKG